MPTYATITDFEDHVEGWTTDDPDALNAMLEAAERDLDALAWPLRRRRAGAPKLDPDELEPEDREGLVAATCAQARYRYEMGPEFFVRAQRQRVTSKAVSTEGKLPVLGPETQRELTAGGLWRLTTSSRRRGCDPDRWQSRP